MIQRKQSIWLLLAALLASGVFYFDLYRVHTQVTGVDTMTALRVSDHFPSLLIALVMCIVPLIAIFMFNNRKLQTRLAAVAIVADLSFVGMVLARVSKISDMPGIQPADSTYWIGSVLPVVAIVFLIMAIVGIRKDEKLVKSVDRLR